MENKKILQAIKLATNNENLDFELAKLSMNEIMSERGNTSPIWSFYYCNEDERRNTYRNCRFSNCDER